MGWFDHDDKEKTTAAPGAAPRPAQPAPQPAKAPTGGSTLGERVQVKGTIVSEEDLTILGNVEGTIHARQSLVIAKEADVKAVIHVRKVLVEGKVNGDVNATEVVVLGATGSLTGNIATPSLQIREGAYFKGQVEMQAAVTDAPPAERKPDKPKAPAAADNRPAPSAAGDAGKRTESAASGSGKSGEPARGDNEGQAAKSAAAAS